MRTNTPWYVSDAVGITPSAKVIVGDNVYIAEMYALGEEFGQCEPEEAEANAEFIVKAVNNYDALVEALEDCLYELQLLLDYQDHPDIIKAMKKAQQVLAQMKG